MQAVDTNVLAYAAGIRQADSDEPKVGFAAEFVQRLLTDGDIAISAQVLAELHHILRRKGGRTAAAAARSTFEYAAAAYVVPTDEVVLRAAFDLTTEHGLQTYDAIVLAAAARAGSDLLYSEDMQDGFSWGGVTIVNPFA